MGGSAKVACNTKVQKKLYGICFSYHNVLYGQFICDFFVFISIFFRSLSPLVAKKEALCVCLHTCACARDTHRFKLGFFPLFIRIHPPPCAMLCVFGYVCSGMQVLLQPTDLYTAQYDSLSYRSLVPRIIFSCVCT